MGAGLPLAMGAKSVNPDKKVLLYTGDGSFGFNAFEVTTAVRLNLPLIIIIHNDEAWGFCRDTQKTIFPGENPNYGTELGVVRYDKMVESLGGIGELITDPDEIKDALKRALKSDKVYCLNVVVDKNAMSPGANVMNDAIKPPKKIN
jgi:acetolactate synthase-1/2/3 large subunit